MRIKKVTIRKTILEEDDEEIALKKQKIARIKSIVGIVCISIAIFIFFIPFSMSSLPLPYVIFSYLTPILTASLLVFIIPKKPILYLFLFYTFCALLWFFVLDNMSILNDISKSVKYERYFIFLFPLFVIFFIVGNYLYSKNSDFFAYVAVLSLLFLFMVQ